MNNYEYIIASLPVISLQNGDNPDCEDIIAQIREQLCASDNDILDFFLQGYDPDSLNEEFYRRALSSRDTFIREYFRYDLCLRNAKVNYLNRELGRKEGTDVKDIDCGELDGLDEIDAVLNGKDLLLREKGLDDLLWNKAEDLSVLETFSLDAVLSFVARMKIVERWLTLDEEKGRELFRRIVKEIKETYII